MSFTYDDRGRLKTETDVFGHVTERVYDAASRRTQLKLDGSVHTTYNYDNANRLTTLTDEASQNFTFGYDVADRLISKALPNGVNTTYEYDGMSRLKRLKDVGPSGTLFDRQYGYDTANQISQITEPSLSRNFGYDNIDRLTSVTGGATENYAFDSVGNRTSSHRSNAYGYQPFNKLASTQTATYKYDVNGNMISKSEGSNLWRYTWDCENRLSEASTRKQRVRYKYDALGRRVRRVHGAEDTKFTYDGLDVVMDDDTGSGITKYQNGLGIDSKLKLTNGGNSKYFLQDHLGSTVGLTDSSGNITSAVSYDSFGNSTNNLASRYRYTGREYDAYSGLYYYRSRWYDPNLGRFISEDPIGFRGGDRNLYAYVWNNPIKFSDPRGLFGEQPTSANPQGIQPSSNPPSVWDMVRDWFVQVWGVGIPFRIGAGTSTTGTMLPGAGEACSTLQVGPDLYKGLGIVGEKNGAINDALRCSQGDCTPRQNPSWQDGLGPWSPSGYQTGYDQRGEPQH